MDAEEISDLADFVLARVAEDQSVVTQARESWSDRSLWSAERTLNAFRAKQMRATALASVVARFEHAPPVEGPGVFGSADMLVTSMQDLAVELLRLEAWPYADHPDWRTSWRP